MAGNSRTPKSAKFTSVVKSPTGRTGGTNKPASTQSTAQVSKMKMGGKVGKKK